MDLALFNLYWRESSAADTTSYTHKVHMHTTLDDANPLHPVRYMAAAPPDSRTSFSGSGLPAPDIFHAFSGGHTCGTAHIGQNGTIELTIPSPNAFWINCGMTMMPPSVFFVYKQHNGRTVLKEVTMLNEVVPYRDIMRTQHVWGHPSNLVTTQEDKLRQTEYPIFKHSLQVQQ